MTIAATTNKSANSTLGAFKLALAETVQRGLKSSFPSAFEDESVISVEQILSQIERPRKVEFGDLALPLFPYVKLLKQAPPKVYEAITDPSNLDPKWGELTFAGGYLNLTVNTESFAESLFNEINVAHGRFGSSTEGVNQRMLVEYSSPNIAKPFGIGHLRSTVVGAALHRVYAFLGYESFGINYLGDWGTQFGKMIVAYKKWDGAKVIEDDPIHGALELYVRFHEEEEKDPALTDQAREEFKKLEQGDAESVRLWEMFKNVSKKEFERVYTSLGVKFDLITGESFFNDKMEDVIDRLDKAGLTSESRGALVVDLEKYNLPPCLLRKQDGATLYATRDIAGLIYRWDKYPFRESLYVVGAAQADHFKQVYAVIELLEIAEGIPQEKRMSGRVKHIPFGWVKFEDQALSTRHGNIIFLDDVLNKATELAGEKIREKNPELTNAETVAKQVGVGAVIFTQLSVRKQKDVNFSWDKSLTFEGETGPYLQYTHARLSSLGRRYSEKHGSEYVCDSSADTSALTGVATRALLTLVSRFPDVVRATGAEYEPFLISDYLLELASRFNTFYQQKDEAGQIVRIISSNKTETDARMALVSATREVISNGLALLGISAPEEM